MQKRDDRIRQLAAGISLILLLTTQTMIGENVQAAIFAPRAANQDLLSPARVLGSNIPRPEVEATDENPAPDFTSQEPVFGDASTSRLYLVETARPGGTMSRQGAEVAIGRLNPEFVTRLANAIWQARQSGLTAAGVFSAYRPPAFGVGGFHDKFMSLHSYGLAVDMHGIGGPGSPDAFAWHRIAEDNGISCPYGASHPAEWNHCQALPNKMIRADHPLRATVTADGPADLDAMFEEGARLIAKLSNSAEGETVMADNPTHRSSSAVALWAPPSRRAKTRLPAARYSEKNEKKLAGLAKSRNGSKGSSSGSRIHASLRIYEEESHSRSKKRKHAIS